MLNVLHDDEIRLPLRLYILLSARTHLTFHQLNPLQVAPASLFVKFIDVFSETMAILPHSLTHISLRRSYNSYATTSKAEPNGSKIHLPGR